MFGEKMKIWLSAMLAAVLFCGMAQVAFAASYELTRVDLYNYYDDDDNVRINSADIESSMEKTVEWRRILIVPTISKGSYKISGADGTDSDGNYYVALDEGESTKVTISIYNSSDERQARYYLELTRGSTGVEKVVFTGDDWEKTITSVGSTNSLKIPLSESELRMKVYLEDDDYTVECNGSTSSKNSWDISIPKNKTVTVEIVLLNDDDKEVAAYEFEIERSSDADEDDTLDLLSGLKVKGSDDSYYDLFPSYENGIDEYFVCFPSDVRSAVIIPTLGSDGDTVKVNSKSVNSGSESRDLDVTTSGSSYVVRVTDYDDEDHDITVTLMRTSASKGTTATLDKLKVKRGSSKSSLTEIDLDPDFESYTYYYEISAGDDSAYFSFRTDLSDDDGIALLFDGTEVSVLEDGSYSSAIKLEEGDVAIIRAYSPNFENYREYNLEVEGSPLDDNAYLEDLILYIDGVKATLSPEFDTKTYAYTVTVSDSADEFKVKAETEEDSSTLTIMGDEYDSKETSDVYSLGSNFTNIPVVVTAEDGTSNTYRITVSRSGNATSSDGSTSDSTASSNKIELNKDLRVVLRVGSMTYIANGETKTLAAAPYITSSRTQVPLRVIAEALGAGVNYNSEAKQITINLGTERIYMDIGKTIKDFDVAPEVKANTTFVPVRYISEKMGLKCTYNNASKEVVITMPDDDEDE